MVWMNFENHKSPIIWEAMFRDYCFVDGGASQGLDGICVKLDGGFLNKLDHDG